MANWNVLKAAVANIINANGNQEITGQLLQNVLNNIITNVGENATFAGIATLDTNPGAPDGPVFYLATTAGVYPNFNGLEVLDGEAIIFLWNNSAWTKKVTGFVTQEKMQELEENTNEKLSQLGSKYIKIKSYIDGAELKFEVDEDVYKSFIVPFVMGEQIKLSITNLIHVKKITGLYINYIDGTKTTYYNIKAGFQQELLLANDIKDILVYVAPEDVISYGYDYISVSYADSKQLTKHEDVVPMIEALEEDTRALSEEMLTNKNNIVSLESVCQIQKIESIKEEVLTQISDIRVGYKLNTTSKSAIGFISTKIIDVALQYLDINGGVLNDTGWKRELNIDTTLYPNTATLSFAFRKSSGETISTSDVSLNANISLSVYSQVVTESNLRGVGNVEYYGQKLNIDILSEKRYCSNELLYTQLNREDIPLLTSVQALAIYDNLAFISIDGNSFIVMDLLSYEIIHQGTFPESHHNNAMQFSTTKYNESDRFPLLLLSTGDYDNPSNKVMVLRIANDYSTSKIKDIACTMSNVKFNGSFVADFQTNRLWLYTYTNDYYGVRENNNIVVYEFALPDIKEEATIFLSKNDVKNEFYLPVCILQDAIYYAGKLWFPCGVVDYINGYPVGASMGGHWFLVVNPENGFVENLIKGVEGLEPQGIDFHNGKMYFICKNSGVTEVGRTAFRLYEYSFYPYN